MRRSAPGRYFGRLEPVDVAPDGSRRERATATTTSIARAFERVVADAPEQWWAVFFPIWPDLAASGATEGREPAPAAVTSGP